MARATRKKNAKLPKDIEVDNVEEPMDAPTLHSKDEEPDELWDIVSELGVKSKKVCMTDGCNKRAVAEWVSNLKPNEPWRACEQCQKDDFGGWPEDFDRQHKNGSKETKEKIDCSDDEFTQPPEDAESLRGPETDCDTIVTKGIEKLTNKENVNASDAKEDKDVQDVKEDAAKSNTVNSLNNCEISDLDNPQQEKVPERGVGFAINIGANNELQIENIEDNGKSATVSVKSDREIDDNNLECDFSDISYCTPDDDKIDDTNKIEVESYDKSEVTNNGLNTENVTDDAAEEHEDVGAKIDYIDDKQQMNGDEPSEGWDLKRIFSISEVSKVGPAMCMTDDCLLVACSVWLSNLNPTKPWNSCLDCQANDFDGWPEPDELPFRFLTVEHRNIISEKCTRFSSPPMPDVPTNPVNDVSPPTSVKSLSSAVTPPPKNDCCKDINEDQPTNTKGTVTPSPCPPLTHQPSTAALAMHRKWQEAAEAISGTDARIVVSKPAAKKVIFDILNFGFRPMNITEIYQKLKATVPSPVLKSCLDDMALDRAAHGNPFDDSDDEGNEKPTMNKKNISPLSSEVQFAGSLLLKEGRNTNTTLYFVDYSKLHNNGDGLLPDDRNKLLSDYEIVKVEVERINDDLRLTLAQTTQLLSEPTNADASIALENEEKNMEALREKIESSSSFKENEKRRRQLISRIESMVAQWRSRKRIAIDFLAMMEESTDGTVNLKKCMSGDGQIDIDSDEAVAKGALSFGKKKRERQMKGHHGVKTPIGGRRVTGGDIENKKARLCHEREISYLAPSESFVAVLLDAHGNVERVHLDAE